MAPIRLGWFALALGSGCDPVREGAGSLTMDVFFPFDGERTWEFVNDDPEIPYHVVATLDSDPRVRVFDGARQAAYTIRYQVDCIRPEAGCVTGDSFRIRSLTLSSDFAFGTLLHEVDTVAEGLETFDPPMLLTGSRGRVGDVWEGASGGGRLGELCHAGGRWRPERPPAPRLVESRARVRRGRVPMA